MIYDLPANTYLVLLVMIEIIMLIFSLLGRFTSGMYFVAMRIIFLVMAQCCNKPRSAAFYSVLALMNGFYAFDPVGLFITGRNFCVICRWATKNIPSKCVLCLSMCTCLYSLILRVSVQNSFGKRQS